MHKDGKWAKQIISLQDEEGKWGCFHSLSQFYNAPITAEQALRRLEYLGYTIEDECIQKAVRYMDDCLIGKNAIPDRREKVHDWDIFISMILSTWLGDLRMIIRMPIKSQDSGQVLFLLRLRTEGLIIMNMPVLIMRFWG